MNRKYFLVVVCVASLVSISVLIKPEMEQRYFNGYKKQEAFQSSDEATHYSLSSEAVISGRNKNNKSDPVKKIEAIEPEENSSVAGRNIDMPPSYGIDADLRYQGDLLKHRVQEMQNRRSGKTFSEQEVEKAMAKDTAWESAKEPPKSLPLKKEELHDGRYFIEFDSVKVETLMPGDQMTVMVEEGGKEYSAIIDRIKVHDGERVSWYGHLLNVDPDREYRLSFTRGSSLTVGGMDTPDGHYVIQAHGNDGWIASSAQLFKIDPSKSDAIIPPTLHN